MFGWHGRLLRIDLSRRKTSIESIDPKILRDFIGRTRAGDLLSL